MSYSENGNGTNFTMPVQPYGGNGGWGNNGFFGDGAWWLIVLLLFFHYFSACEQINKSF